MAKEQVFTTREARLGAWLVVITLALTALGLSGQEFGAPSIPDRPSIDSSVLEAQPLIGAGVGL